MKLSRGGSFCLHEFSLLSFSLFPTLSLTFSCLLASNALSLHIVWKQRVVRPRFSFMCLNLCCSSHLCCSQCSSITCTAFSSFRVLLLQLRTAFQKSAFVISLFKFWFRKTLSSLFIAFSCSFFDLRKCLQRSVAESASLTVISRAANFAWTCSAKGNIILRVLSYLHWIHK